MVSKTKIVNGIPIQSSTTNSSAVIIPTDIIVTTVSSNILPITGSNLGIGVGIYAGSNGSGTERFEFRSIVAGDGISIQTDANTITITGDTGRITPVTDINSLSGILEVTSGGTGLSSIAANAIMFGDGNKSIKTIAAPTIADTYLKWTGSSYTWVTLLSLTGATGLPGPAGTNGAVGATGLPGPAGTNGAVGATGLQGPTGATGLQGPAGTSGTSSTALNSVNQFTKNQSVAPTNIGYASTVNVDSSLSNNFMITLTGDIILNNPTALTSGMVLNFIVTQDSVGSRKISYGTMYKFQGDVQPTLSTTAGYKDFISCYFDGTILICNCSIGFSAISNGIGMNFMNFNNSANSQYITLFV